MTLPLDIAVSPYHLATREAPAMAALVLGTSVVTFLPHPAAGTSRHAVLDAVERSPRYLRLLEAWRWSTPLWRAGIISAVIDGHAPCDAIGAVYEDVRADPAFTELRPLMSAMDRLRDENAAAYLDAMSNDLLRGGPDPGISIPVNAALERFGADHGYILARGVISSIAQRAEARLGVKVFSIGIPLLLQAGGRRLLELREDLADTLEPLRSAITDLLSEPTSDPVRLQTAAAAYAADFSAWVEAGLAAGDDDTGKRVVPGYVGLNCLHMPEDAVLRSSRAAVRAMRGAWSGGEPHPPTATEQHPPRGRFTIIIRELSVRPEV
ncbi:MAG: hypothetical protein ACK4WH_06350 [Phycisphaerales bacterium]